MFPRNRLSWTELVEKYGMTICWQIGVKYCILTSLAYKIFKLILPRKKKVNIEQKISGPGKYLVFVFFKRFLGWLDLIIDPYTWPFVPKKNFILQQFYYLKKIERW